MHKAGVDVAGAQARSGSRSSMSSWRRWRWHLAAWLARLDLLGDAVLGLAVVEHLVHRNGPQARASVLTSNAHLDERFNRSSAVFTSAQTGDVIEALIGAVHLDAGYVAADWLR